MTVDNMGFLIVHAKDRPPLHLAIEKIVLGNGKIHFHAQTNVHPGEAPVEIPAGVHPTEILGVDARRICVTSLILGDVVRCFPRPTQPATLEIVLPVGITTDDTEKHLETTP